MSIYDPMLDNGAPRASNRDKTPAATLKSLSDADALNAFRSGRTIVIHTVKTTYLFNRIAHTEAALLSALKSGHEFTIS